MTKNWNKPTVEALDVRMTFGGNVGTSEQSIVDRVEKMNPGHPFKPGDSVTDKGIAWHISKKYLTVDEWTAAKNS